MMLNRNFASGATSKERQGSKSSAIRHQTLSTTSCQTVFFCLIRWRVQTRFAKIFQEKKGKSLILGKASRGPRCTQCRLQRQMLCYQRLPARAACLLESFL